MAKEDVKRSEDEKPEDEQPVVNRDYQQTWGSTRQAKAEFAVEHQDDAEETEEDAAKVEAARPGVNPVTAPRLDAQGKVIKP